MVANTLQILSFDVSPQGELGVFGAGDGMLRVFDIEDGAIRVCTLICNTNL